MYCILYNVSIPDGSETRKLDVGIPNGSETRKLKSILFLYSRSFSHLPGLLRAELNEWSSAEEEAEHVGHHVVDHHHQDGQDEPDQS